MFNEHDYDKITAATVYDRDGDKVGRVGRLYLDDETNQPAWVTVATGLFGTSESFVPIDDATLSGDRLTVPHDKALIKDAPRINSDGHLEQSEEAELYRHYSRDYSRLGDRDVAADRRDVDRDRVDVGHDRDRVDVDRDRDDAVSMTAAEERLNVGTEQVEAGRARLRRHVTTEQETVSVPVQKEVLTIDREPVTGETQGRDRIGDSDGEIEDIVLREERPVVSKEVHDVERVKVGKETVTEQEQVSDEVKKEHIAVEGEAVRDRDRNI